MELIASKHIPIQPIYLRDTHDPLKKVLRNSKACLIPEEQRLMDLEEEAQVLGGPKALAIFVKTSVRVMREHMADINPIIINKPHFFFGHEAEGYRGTPQQWVIVSSQIVNSYETVRWFHGRVKQLRRETYCNCFNFLHKGSACDHCLHRFLKAAIVEPDQPCSTLGSKRLFRFTPEWGFKVDKEQLKKDNAAIKKFSLIHEERRKGLTSVVE